MIRCPHCGCPAHTRRTEYQSELTRELRYQCTNIDCGHTFVSLEQIVRTISPSAIPSKRIKLPWIRNGIEQSVTEN